MSNNTHEKVGGIGGESFCSQGNEGNGGHIPAINGENGGVPCECVQCEVFLN